MLNQLTQFSRLTFQITLLTVLASCGSREEPDPKVSLAFGEAYGFCVGDCAHFFQLKENGLYKDNIERYTGDKPTFEATTLPRDKYDLANSLLMSFPEYLINHPNQTFGCPDCADQGGIHLYYNEGTSEYFWHIDSFVDEQPIEIRQYISQLRVVISELRK